jgi:excisionase family DNA binding protein
MAPPELMTAQEVAAWLKIRRIQSVYALIREHGMPASRLKRHWRFNREQIEQWMRGQAQAMIPHPTVHVPATQLPGLTRPAPRAPASRRERVFAPGEIDAELKRIIRGV